MDNQPIPQKELAARLLSHRLAVRGETVREDYIPYTGKQAAKLRSETRRRVEMLEEMRQIGLKNLSGWEEE